MLLAQQQKVSSQRWIAENLFAISEEEFLRNQREMFHDRMMTAQMDQAAEATDMGAGGGAGALLGAPGGGEDLLGSPDEAPTEEPATEEPATEEPATEEPETNLLAVPPANRDDDLGKMKKRVGGKTYTTTAKSKSWYEPRKDLSGKRAMQRQMSSDAGSNLASSTSRNINKGYSDLSRLARGISEEQEPNIRRKNRKSLRSIQK